MTRANWTISQLKRAWNFRSSARCLRVGAARYQSALNSMNIIAVLSHTSASLFELLTADACWLLWMSHVSTLIRL